MRAIPAIALLAATLISALSASGQLGERPASAPPVPLHGTVNIILGNENGLVVVTDSRLSDPAGNPIPGDRPKLFQLDDHTVCAIAGFYGDPGPTLGHREFPGYTLISQIIDDYIAARPGLESRSISRKVESLANVMKFSLTLVMNMNLASVNHVGQPNSITAPPDSFITVAGYENGSIEVIKTHLVPAKVGEGYEYVQKPVEKEGICANTFTLAKSFECSFAGLTSIADRILAGEDQASANNPAVAKFLKAKKAGKTNMLSIEDLEQLAQYLKSRSSDPPQQNVVGGQTQMAKLVGGKVAFQRAVEPLGGPKPASFDMYQGDLVSSPQDPFYPIRGGVGVAPGFGVLVSDSVVSDIIQPLDKIIFMRTSFSHCRLLYDGSPMTIFDQSNTVQDCTLFVSNPPDMQSDVVKKIKKDYPQLNIVQRIGPHASAWRFWIGPVPN